jgi:hypothetical protein
MGVAQLPIGYHEKGVKVHIFFNIKQSIKQNDRQPERRNVNVIFRFLIFYKLTKMSNLFLLWHFGVLCVD